MGVIEASVAAKNAADALFTEIKLMLSAKVDKVTGKGLSENDFTTPLKAKVDGSVQSTDFTSIVKVTESNYPTTPDPTTLYLIVAD
jgi:hypothetical protein